MNIKIKCGLLFLSLCSINAFSADYVDEGKQLKNGHVVCVMPSMKAGDTFKCGDGEPYVLESNKLNGDEVPTTGGDVVDYYNHDNDLDGGEAWRASKKKLKEYKEIATTRVHAPSGIATVGSTPIWYSTHSTNIYNWDRDPISYNIKSELIVDGSRINKSFHKYLNYNDDYYYNTRLELAKTFDSSGRKDTKATITVSGHNYRFVQDTGTISVHD